MDIYTVLALLILFLVTIWIIHRRKLMSTFKKYGIPGPEPNLIFGNLFELNRKETHVALKDWERQYGKVFGYYLGAQPTLVVCDADICKQIQIKDFGNFVNRPRLIPGEDTQFGKHVFSSKDERWKQQRALMTPGFTSGKMKNMTGLFLQSIRVFMSKVESSAKKDEEFNIHDYFKGLTLDVISKAAFGVQTNVQTNPNDAFLRGAQDVLKEDTFTGLVMIPAVFPGLYYIMSRVIILQSHIQLFLGIDQIRAFFNTCADVVMARRNNPKNRREDLLQMLVDAEMSQQEFTNVSSENLTAGHENEAEVSKDRSVHKKTIRLTDDEVMSNTFITLFAGYDTTSTALSYMSHILVNYPDIQNKIRDEIRNVIEEEGEINYSSIAKMKYLDQVWSETLRYYPPVPSFTNRVAKSEKKYGQWTIPKGVTVQIPVSLLHRDPRYWKEPHKFDPERFSPERRSEINLNAYQPFGAGPRNCIGLRFAQLEAKLALANLLNRYELVPSAKTEIGDVTVSLKFVIMSPKHGVFVKAKEIDV